MSVETYPIELPQSAFSALRKSPPEFIQEMKYAAAVKWYDLPESWLAILESALYASTASY